MLTFHVRRGSNRWHTMIDAYRLLAEEDCMYRFAAILTIAIVFAVTIGLAQHPPASGPYKVLKTVRAGGEGNWDYIYADVAGRRLYIPRRAPVESTIRTRLSIFNLDTLELVSEIDGVGGNGTAVDPKSGHGFTSSRPPSMFDTKTMKLIKTIEVGPGAAPDRSEERRVGKECRGRGGGLR